MDNEILYELFIICCVIIMFAITIMVLLGISAVCVCLIRCIVDIVKGRRTHLF